MTRKELIDKVHEIDKHNAASAEILKSMDEKLDGLCQTLAGNGKPGLVMRVDRLETFKRISTTFIWTTITAVVGSAAAYAFGVIK